MGREDGRSEDHPVMGWIRVESLRLNITRPVPFEVGNALTAMMKKNTLKKEEVESAWDIVQQIPVDLRHTNIKYALSIAIKYNLYAYDAYFLECAENLRSPLLTLDLGMQKVAREMRITILE
ncbi:type II toxin-antitoxin system VapC family toxin [Thermodesulfobacteriota bacterium]